MSKGTSSALLLAGLTILALSASCDKTEPRRNTADDLADSAFDHSGLSVRDVHAETLSADPALTHIAWPLVAGKHLWVSHAYDEPFFHIIDTVTGRIVASLGRKGQGPGEFEHANIMVGQHGDTTLWVWDPQRFTITQVSHARLSGEDTSAFTIVTPAKGRGFLFPRGKAGFLMLAQGQRPPGTPFFTLFSRGGDVVATSDVPLPGDEDVPKSARFRAFGGTTVCANWDRSGFALLYRYAGRIQMYDSLARPTTTVGAPYPHKEVFAPSAKDGSIVLDENREYYLSCAFSRDRLFAVFSGKIVRWPKNEEPRDDARFIHVFNFKGELVEVLRLDQLVTTITVDAEGKRIFGAAFRDPVIYRIDVR